MNENFKRLIWIFSAICISLSLVYCGGNGTYAPTTVGQGNPPVVGIAISPHTTTITVNGTVQFTAVVTGTSNTGVTWNVQPVETISHRTVTKADATGSISNTGLYTAPATSGTYTVTGTSQADPSKFDTATVTVQPAAGITVTVVPPTATTLALAPFQFSAVVTGTTNHNVTWSMVPTNSDQNSQATLSSSGVFLSNYFSGGGYVVTATSQADPTKFGTGTMTISGGSTVKITAIPLSVNLLTGQSIQCSATVTGNANTSVFWQIQPVNVGSISETGLYTAGSSPGTTTIYVSSQVDPTKSVAIPVTVNNG